ncbi:DUSP22 [Bugula neritina]|uniref:DUSP22 n=1 Tax=Bugula neritina TaxID=10212 RepID=A0A7J7KDH0_BUGNE|nr:DUSP22 [Bugula neritina]
MTGYSICDQHLAMGHGMSKVLEGLYIGNYGDSVNIQQLQQHSITHILSLYNKNGKRVVFEDIQYLIVEVEDSPSSIWCQSLENA